MSDEETTPDKEPKEGQVVDPPTVPLEEAAQGDAKEANENLYETMHLARAARDGEEEQFEKLYERVAPSLFSWARLRIPPAVRPFLDEQDVVQEVWIRAIEIIDRYDPDKVNFRAWIFRVAKNVLLEAMRKLRAAPRLRMELTDRVWVATEYRFPIGYYAFTSYSSVGLGVGVNGWKKRR